MTPRSSLSIAIWLLLVFSSGILVGGFGYRLYMVTSVSATSTPQETPAQHRAHVVAMFKERIGLRPEQLSQLNPILDDWRAKSKEIHGRIDPALDELRLTEDAKIRVILDPGQQPEFDKWCAERMKAEQENRK
jgi:hypothetical protein